MAVSKNTAIDSKSQESFTTAAEAQDFDHRGCLRDQDGRRGKRIAKPGIPINKGKMGSSPHFNRFSR